MIKRKKKIIKLKNPTWKVNDGKKLPEDYSAPRTINFELLSMIDILFMFPKYTYRNFSQLVCLWNQGGYCFDCYNKNDPGEPVFFKQCVCEKCEECTEKYCICPIETKEQIYKTTWEFIKLVLNKQDIEEFKERLEGCCYDSNYKTIKNIFNNSSFPSYPKYKKIAKELFRLD